MVEVCVGTMRESLGGDSSTQAKNIDDHTTICGIMEQKVPSLISNELCCNKVV